MTAAAAPTIPADKSAQVTLYDSYEGSEGHRAEYYALFARVLGTQRTASLLRALLTRQPVLVGALEASLGRYFVIGLVRALLGRNTVGLLFRPLPVLDPVTLKLKFKRAVLRAMLHLPRVSTMTILPFSLEPRFAEVAASWIYDPQFWDLHYPGDEGVGAPGPLAARVRAAAAGRSICCAIGRQDIDKGFDQFVQLYCHRADLRKDWLFAFGGWARSEIDDQQVQLAAVGGFGHPGYIDQAELLDLYACADLVWCSYAPDYDQASGIFGRAVQLGIPVIVRSGSLIHRFCVSEQIAHIAYSGQPGEFSVAAAPAGQSPVTAAARARGQAHLSLARLRYALGLTPPEPAA